CLVLLDSAGHKFRHFIQTDQYQLSAVVLNTYIDHARFDSGPLRIGDKTDHYYRLGTCFENLPSPFGRGAEGEGGLDCIVNFRCFSADRPSL
ncbi:MAG: hypothetical protein JW959_05285, partial [Pirellulales bacterium]|nr:hypothetical protein [Pirellulales bacterium]